ncbi:MAG TPA: serine/threonine-protein kinase [Isosphaeraceae bacterium]|jgi:serine/threonine-protein kinase|nr:serine/threonine-protein kinase [Isosphaeraceae bacterium]
MATSDKPKRAGTPVDLLPVIRKSGVLTDKQFDELRANVLSGDYPNDSHMLADRLVKEKLLTEYQVHRFLSNKSHGLTVGRYVILDRVGSGSMGRVYKATHRLMGRVVAIKIIAPEIVTNERVVARFQREMRLVGRLDHPNVVRAYDADQIERILYIVMEYVPGESLGTRLRVKGPIPPVEVVHFAAQAALGLGHAHAQGIVHRDIKPSNLYLSDSRQVKVLDLGLGVLMEADTQASFATADGIAVGTIDYMSPEQATGKEVDGRSDLYSLGCAMYHLMTGLLPFPGDSPIERLGKRINERPVPLSDVLPRVPRRLAETMDKLMATKPSDRFQTGEEAAAALQSLTRKRSAPRPAPATVQPRGDAQDDDAGVAVSVEPALPPAVGAAELPRWLQPLVALAERSPTGALVTLIGTLAAMFGIGLMVGWALL